MFRLTKYINIPVFLVALFLGLAMVRLFDSPTRRIYVYPKPDTFEHIQYRDATGTCFDVKQTETKCPKDASEISKIPAQS